MRRYHVHIKAEFHTPVDPEDKVLLKTICVEFEIGNLRHDNPRLVAFQLMEALQVRNYMQLVSVNEVEVFEDSMLVWPEAKVDNRDINPGSGNGNH